MNAPFTDQTRFHRLESLVFPNSAFTAAVFATPTAAITKRISSEADGMLQFHHLNRGVSRV